MTTKTKKALAWIAEGKPRKDMETDLGLSADERRMLMNSLLKHGYVEPAYVLTEKGRQRVEHMPKSDPKRLAYWRDHYYRSKPATAEQTVDRAKRIPNSVFALGAM